LDDLLAALDERLSAGMEVAQLAVPAGDGAKLAWLYRHGEVLESVENEGLVRIKVRLSPADRARFGQLA
jgi:GTP-binding protein HflX